MLPGFESLPFGVTWLKTPGTFWPSGQGHPAALQVAARLYLPEVLENHERIYHEGR